MLGELVINALGKVSTVPGKITSYLGGKGAVIKRPFAKKPAPDNAGVVVVFSAGCSQAESPETEQLGLFGVVEIQDYPDFMAQVYIAVDPVFVPNVRTRRNRVKQMAQLEPNDPVGTLARSLAPRLGATYSRNNQTTKEEETPAVIHAFVFFFGKRYGHGQYS